MAVAIEILRCSGCGAPVPLGDGDVVRCAFCAANVSVPTEHRELRDAVRADAAARTRAAELYAEVGAPPSLVLRGFALVTPLALVILGLPFILIAAIILFDRAGGAIGRALLHVQLLDVWPERFQTLASYGLAALLALALLVLGAYGRRRGVSLRTVQAGLAMRPPTREGGPATCRVCGAPLTIPSDANGVMCDYCRADNLVRVPAKWIAKAQHATKKLAGAIEDATAEHRAEVAALRSRLRARLIGWGVIAFIFFGAFAIGFSTTEPRSALDDWPPIWRADLAGDRTMHAHRATVRGIDQPIHPDHSVAPSCVGPWLGGSMGAWSTPASCDASGCTFRWIVALRHGERVTVRTETLNGAQLHLYRHRPSYKFEDSDFEPWQTVTMGPSTAFEAPLSAWYAVGLRIADMRPKEGRSLCFTIAGAK